MPKSRRLSVRDLETRYSKEEPITTSVLDRLRRDRRKGVRRLYRKLARRRDAEEQERARVRMMRLLETRLWSEGVSRVAGVDEVGIGPMAGPVVAGAVVFPPGGALDAVDDSKRLSASEREALEGQIRAQALAVGIGIVDVPDVDRLNVYHAGLLAMRRAVDSLGIEPDHVLVDARTIPELPFPQRGLPKGDTLSVSIAAASIVAKVHRDRLMMELDAVYPGYGFRDHKGYCSPSHQAAVKALGPSEVHRRSFDFIRELTGEYDAAFYDLEWAARQLRTLAEYRDWLGRLEITRSRMPARAARKLKILAARHLAARGLILTV